MRFVADVHLHSHYSRATSRDLDPERVHKWSALKGVDVVGTADFTHPEWLAEIKEKLEPVEEGLYRLRRPWREPIEAELPRSCGGEVRFMLSVEISSIYKKNDRTRKVHNVVILPDFDSVDDLNQRLGAIGNLKSDGRPILGLDSRDLLEICLEVCPDVLFIPAHIWTPHFAALGASSGFDSLEECYEDLLPHIHAVETGLSSDPPMNGRLSALDRYSIVSNSDAHSPRKLAREATCFDTDLSYPAILDALRSGDPSRFAGTIEFYPEEGKYHYDGHRKCGVRWKPSQTLAAGGLCPQCGRKVTVGVLHRVEKLADRAEEEAIRGQFEYLVPLAEVIGSAVGVGPNSKKVQGIYHSLIERLGPELDILRFAPTEQIAACDEPLVAEAVRRMRAGTIHIEPGYDGEFGEIEVFTEEERKQLQGQARLFDMSATTGAAAVLQEMAADPARKRLVDDLIDTAATFVQDSLPPAAAGASSLDGEQRLAAEAEGGPIVVIAGPGSGKTRTLTHRIVHLIRRGTAADRIAAVTFTNRAAAEMRQRLVAQLSEERCEQLTVGTFHRLALDLNARYGNAGRNTVLDRWEARAVLAEVIEEEGLSLKAAAALEQISLLKSKAADPDGGEMARAYHAYRRRLQAYGARDYDDILLDLLHLLETDAETRQRVREQIEYLLVDEFQDVNPVQYRLVRLIAGPGTGLFVIGDPNQAIYGFRGADPECFRTLSDDFATVQTFTMRRNYRSQAPIVRAAAALTDGDTEANCAVSAPHDALVARPLPSASDRIRLVTTPSETAEGIAVVREISRLVGGADMVQTDRHQADGGGGDGGFGFGDIAVLFRTGRQGSVLEGCFLTEGLPYRFIGQTGFLEEPAVRQVVAFLRHAVEPSSPLRFMQLLRQPGFHPGKKVMARIAAGIGGDVSPESLRRRLPPATAAKLDEVWRRAAEYRAIIDRKRPVDILLMLQSELSTEAVNFAAGYERLIAMAEAMSSVAELLDTLVLGTDADVEVERCGGVAVEAVTLMTMHAAKGLEFPVVLICGAEDGLLPLREPGRSVDVDEERRLLYVALTRARERVVLLRAQRRSRYGKQLQPELSPFVLQLPADLVTEEVVQLPRRERADQLSLF